MPIFAVVCKESTTDGRGRITVHCSGYKVSLRKTQPKGILDAQSDYFRFLADPLC